MPYFTDLVETRYRILPSNVVVSLRVSGLLVYNQTSFTRHKWGYMYIINRVTDIQHKALKLIFVKQCLYSATFTKSLVCKSHELVCSYNPQTLYKRFVKFDMLRVPLTIGTFQYSAKLSHNKIRFAYGYKVGR